MDDFEIFFKYAGAGMAVVAMDGTFLSVNASLCKFLQISDTELVGKTFMDITHPDDLQRDVNSFINLVAGDIPSYTMEKRYKIAGHYMWGLLTAIRVEEKNYIIREIHNINHLKRKEDIQKELKDFAYAASHDLREPLRTINGYAYMLKSTSQTLPPTFEYYVNNMAEAANRMSDMLDGLLDYSRISRGGNYADINLEKIINLARKNLEKKIEESKTVISVKGKGKLGGIKGQLVQLFQNLIDNSIKYKSEEKNPHINIRIESFETYVMITFSDNGIGMDEKDHKRAFQIFKQLHPKNKYGGRGIGLSIVKQIVDYHQGQIWVKSGIGEGTTFFISLPSSASQEKQFLEINY